MIENRKTGFRFDNQALFKVSGDMPEIDTPKLIGELSKLDTISLPKNSTELNIFAKEVQKANEQTPITIFAGSCPDYSHTNGLYDHRFLGESVPLLAEYHLTYSLDFFKNWMKLEFRILTT